jgi:hypothetical protein
MVLTEIDYTIIILRMGGPSQPLASNDAHNIIVYMIQLCN